MFLCLAGCLIVVSCFLRSSSNSVFIYFCLCFVVLVQEMISAPLGETNNILFRGPGRNRRNKFLKRTQIPMFWYDLLLFVFTRSLLIQKKCLVNKHIFMIMAV